MSVLSDSLQNKIVDYWRGVQPPAPPATYYVALMTAPATDAGGGTELSGDGYARASIPANMASWAGTQANGSTTASTGTSGVTSNNIEISFNVITADKGSVGYCAIYDAATGGNLLAHGPLQAPVTIEAGNRPKFAVGTLRITFGS